MSLLTAANLQLSYGTQIVLDGATLAVEPGEKIGMVGRNGCGKTSLMRVLLGELEPNTGTVQFRRGTRVGYLSQDPRFEPDDTVRDAAEAAFADLHALHQQAQVLYDRMAEAEGDELDRLLSEQAKIDAAIEMAGGYAIDHRIDAMLHGVGFTNDQFTQLASTLSGGQKGRLGLARLLLEAPDLLLLDEPTNHLDIYGREWLEGFLADEFVGAVLLVSHDRRLLDHVVSRIVEVERGAIRDYPGNYHKYIELRRERQMTEARVHEKQLDRIRQEESFIRRYKTGQRAKQARGRESRLDRYKRNELVEKPLELEVMRLQLPPAARSGEQVITARDIAKQFDSLSLFNEFSLDIARGDRIGIIGPNGTGKTTLVRCLLKNLETDTGEVRHGTRLSVGYYRQSHEHLDLSLTVWQYLQSVIVGLDGQAKASEQQARNLAGAFLFSGGEQDKHLVDLSGGERSRAVLAGLVAGAHNLLVLDEPTNHLDIPSAERLEQALSAEGGFAGTFLLISHDRALIDATCEKLIIFDGEGGARLFLGNYSDWQRKRKEEESERRVQESGGPKAKKSGRNQKIASLPTKQKKQSSLASLTMGRIEERIEEIESRIREIDELLLDSSVYTDGARCRALQEERRGLEKERAPWEEEWARRAGSA